MDSFYVELVSNASMNIYKDNTLASFTNFLPEQINLDGEWDVALSEITCPSLYHNVTDGTFKFFNDITSRSETDEDVTFTIPKGMYYSAMEIVKHMNKLIKDKYNKPSSDLPIKLTWNALDYHIELTLENEIVVLDLSGSNDLLHIFGFDKKKQGILKGQEKLSWRGDFPVDIVRIHSFLVYSDIVDHGVVGDAKAPILRSFSHIPKLKGFEILPSQIVDTHVFTNLQFRPILKKSFHSVKIDLRSSKGDLVPFAGVGITRLSLYFRKRKIIL